MKRIVWASAAALLVVPTIASGQAWIGEMVGNMMAQQAAYAQELACMKGQAMPDAEIAEARTPAPALIRSYWDTVLTGASPASSFLINRHTRWTHGATSLDRATLARLADPFARTGHTLSEQPVGFVRAGDGATALGQWTVSDASGERVGTYHVLFRRQQGRWLISTMQLVDRTEWIDPVVQYCHQPDDVLPFRLSHSLSQLETAERNVIRAETRLTRALERLREDEARAAAAPDNSRRAASLVTARAAVADRERDLALHRTALTTAQAERAAALTDEAAATAIRNAGLAALPKI